MIHKSDFAELFVYVALNEEKLSRDEILKGIKGHYGDVWIDTDDFSIFLKKIRAEPDHDFEGEDDFEYCLTEYVKTQITDEQLVNIIDSATEPFPYFE